MQFANVTCWSGPSFAAALPYIERAIASAANDGPFQYEGGLEQLQGPAPPTDAAASGKQDGGDEGATLPAWAIVVIVVAGLGTQCVAMHPCPSAPRTQAAVQQTF